MAQKQTKSSNFIIQGSILAAAGILVRVVGLAYRIPLLNIIGQEGMGYYSTAYNVYAVVLLLTSYSLPLAVSKLISARLARKDRTNVRRILRLALVYATLVGGLGFLSIWFSADFLAEKVFYLPLSKHALQTLAPTVWVMAYLGVFRGYFQGYGSMVPTAISQILEQIVNAGVSIWAAASFSQRAIAEAKNLSTVRAYGAAGGTLGTGMGALAALFAVLLLFLAGFFGSMGRRRRGRERPKESYGKIAFLLLATVVPVIASTAIYNINGILDSFLFGNSMSKLSQDASVTASQYGIYTGQYHILVNVPVAIASSMASSLIPPLTKAHERGESREVLRTADMALRFCLLISMPSAIGLTVLAKPITGLLFDEDPLAIHFLQLGSAAVLFNSLSTISSAVLQGVHHMFLPVRNALITLIVHVPILLLFLRFFQLGPYGLLYANLLFGFMICLLNALEMRDRLGFRTNVQKTYLGPLLSSLIMGVSIYIIYTVLSWMTQNDGILAMVPFAAALILYPFFLLVSKTLETEEILRFPKGAAILRLVRRLGLLKEDRFV